MDVEPLAGPPPAAAPPVRPSGRASPWRAEVLRLKRRCPRGAGPPWLHAGRPGLEVVSVDLESLLGSDDGAGGADLALRTDLASALLARARRTCAHPALWLARTGEHATSDTDLGWFAAARGAFGEHGSAVRFVVVTRVGWFDPATGRGERWRRARDRRPVPADP